MSKLEKWRQKVRENSITDEKEIMEYMLSKAVYRDKPFRLEVLQSSDHEQILIQGNIEGLTHLRDVIDKVININSFGHHEHLGDGHGLTKADVNVIIQLVGDDNDEGAAHSTY